VAITSRIIPGAAIVAMPESRHEFCVWIPCLRLGRAPE
jgi:hypothetical protein